MTTPSRRPDHFVHAIAVGVLSIALAMAGVRWFLPWLGHPVFVITGGSMAPAIQMGSLVFVSPVPSAEIAAGDVLTYQRDGRRPTTHRVKSVDREAPEVYVAMKGDANAAQDPIPVPARWVIGRVWLTVPALGYVVWFLSLPTGWVSLMSFLLSLVLAARLRDELAAGAQPAARRTGAVVAGIIVLIAVAGTAAGGTDRAANALFADDATVESNTFTTGTW